MTVSLELFLMPMYRFARALCSKVTLLSHYAPITGIVALYGPLGFESTEYMRVVRWTEYTPHPVFFKNACSKWAESTRIGW